MGATLTAVRDGNVRIDWAPTMVAGVLIRLVQADGIPVTLRDHAHRAVPQTTVGTWFTVGQYRPAGQRAHVWLAAKRRPSGEVVYGVDA